MTNKDFYKTLDATLEGYGAAHSIEEIILSDFLDWLEEEYTPYPYRDIVYCGGHSYLIERCPYCNEVLSKEDESCPHCRKPLVRRSKH